MSVSSLTQKTYEDQSPSPEIQAFLKDCLAQLDGKGAEDILSFFINGVFKDKICVSSSFGAESAVLLKLVCDINPHVPVLFIDTGMLFEETVQYGETLKNHLGLKNLQVIRPSPVHLENVDPDGTLHERDPDYCCHIRKVLPFDEGLKPFDALISGRKRFQSESRSKLLPIELDAQGRYKINPLYDWDHDGLVRAFKDMDLPAHPLVEKGYPSIGCAPCTRAVKKGEDQRAGRWAGKQKNECGIHSSPAFEAIHI